MINKHQIAFYLNSIIIMSTTFNNKFLNVISCNYSKDIMVSPIGLYTTLLALTNGTRGETRKQLDNFLEINNIIPYEEMAKLISYAKTTLNTQIGNSTGIYINSNYNLETEYQKQMNNLAIIKSCKNPEDFCEIMNNFISIASNNLFQNVFKPADIGINTTMLIVNVIYFKGKWIKQFKVSKTRKAIFTKFDNAQCNIDFMSGVFSGKFYEDKDVTVVEKPYNDGFSLTIIHPKHNFNNIVSNLQYPTKQEKKIRLVMPKITKEYEIDLHAALHPYINHAFNFSNDFDSMIKMSMRVSDIRQKVIVNINESGTEAAAITSVKMYAMCIKTPKPTLVANSPFIWYIKDSNNLIYFSGVYNGE